MSRALVTLVCGWVLGGLLAPVSSLGQDLFGPPMHFAAGDGPRSVAIGDLNGDQWPDLAVANYIEENVSVLLGVGEGRFAAPIPVPYAPDTGPFSLAIDDLNGDQVSDLAVANWLSDNVSVLLGVGGGRFAAAVHYAVGSGPVPSFPTSVAIGDLDGDQVPDLVVASFSTDVSVLLGRGDGTFGAAGHYPAGLGLASIAIGHLNADQVPDLAVATVYSGVCVLLGVGGGEICRPGTLPRRRRGSVHSDRRPEQRPGARPGRGELGHVSGLR